MTTDLTRKCWWCGKPATRSSFDPYWRVHMKGYVR